MDQLITLDEAAGFLRNPPTLAPHPDFAKIRALCKHINTALMQLVCLQSQIHGWAGLAMEPNMYALLKAVPFAILINPGDTPIYMQFATPSHMKMADAIFLHNKNYYLSYKNINRACFKMLDENVQLQYKVSNLTTMMGWNATMSVRLILKQLEGSYGKPNMTIIHQNDLLFQSPFLPSKAPEMLFYCIEQCQEIQTIAEDPYTPKQIISNAVRLLMTSGIFPLKEFDTWEALPIKTYPILKTFVHKTYARRLMSIQLHNTAGQQGYVQNHNNNIYNVFGEGDDEVTDNDTTITQTAMAATMGSTSGGATNAATSNATIPSEVSAAINQLAANQTAMMNQMVAMQFSPPPPARHTGQGQIHVPPIQQLNIPVLQAYVGGSFQPGQGGGRGQGGRSRQGQHVGGRGCMPFADRVQTLGRGEGGQGFQGHGGPQGTFIGRVQQTRRVNPLNVHKVHNNWNVRFLCCFDIKDGHTSKTCPVHWRKMKHQDAYMHKNAQQFISTEYEPCTKGMHKTVLPLARYT
jgi:hypothetical protein